MSRWRNPLLRNTSNRSVCSPRYHESRSAFEFESLSFRANIVSEISFELTKVPNAADNEPRSLAALSVGSSTENRQAHICAYIIWYLLLVHRFRSVESGFSSKCSWNHTYVPSRWQKIARGKALKINRFRVEGILISRCRMQPTTNYDRWRRLLWVPLALQIRQALKGDTFWKTYLNVLSTQDIG